MASFCRAAACDYLIIVRRLSPGGCFPVKAVLFPFKAGQVANHSTWCMRKIASNNFSSKIAKKPTTAVAVLTSQMPATFLKPLMRHFSVSIVVRGGGARLFNVQTTAFTNRRFFTWFFFYSWLGFFMGGIPTLYLNITEGHAELADIPPGYIPEDWEYYKKPVMRWICRHLYTSEQRNYETFLGGVEQRKEELWAERRNGRIYEIMRERRDYHGWFTTQFTRFRYNEWLYDMANEYEQEMKNPLYFNNDARL